MSYSMYIDDIRDPKGQFDCIVRNYHDAIQCILTNGMPCFISFDHDLGLDEDGNEAKSGYDIAKWIVESALDKEVIIPKDFGFYVHSANLIGKKNIESILENFIKQSGDKK